MGELQRAQTWLENIYVTTLNRVADVTSNIKQDDAICITAAATFTSILAYMGIVRYNRYKNLNLIRAKYPNPDDILNDSEAAHFVYNIVTRKEFPCKVCFFITIIYLLNYTCVHMYLFFFVCRSFENSAGVGVFQNVYSAYDF